MNEVEKIAFIMKTRCRLANYIAKFGGFKLISGSFGLQTRHMYIKDLKFGHRVVRLEEVVK